MNFSPHNYQSYAIDYIETHPVAAVLLDMGLGQTVISLTAIADLLFDSFEAHRILVVAPLRVARDTWPAEISKWQHLKHLTYAVAVGTVKERKAALSAGADITIINRENLGWLIDSSGYEFDYDMVIIDELSSFKNHKSKRFQSLMKVRPKVKRIIGLTGTPSSNGLMDLWAEFKLLDFGERLGRFITHYRNNYFIPDKRNGEIIYSYKPMPYAEDAIYRKISDITISMKSTDHLQMPELITSQYEVQLSENEEQRYEELKADFILELPEGEITAANAASLTGKLSQLANGAIYDDEGNIVEFHDRKLDALEDIIDTAISEDNKLVIIARFIPEITEICKMLDKKNIQYSRICGDVKDRATEVDKFQNNPQCMVFVGQLQTVSMGLTLTASSIMVFYSLSYNFADYSQARARIHRIGQRNVCQYIHLVAKNTIDETVLKALKQKENIAAKIVDDWRSILK